MEPELSDIVHSRIYGIYEKQLLLHLVANAEKHPDSSGIDIIRNWKEITRIFNLLTGRFRSQEQLRNYFNGELKDRKAIKANSDKVQRTRAIRDAALIAKRRLIRDTLKRRTGSDCYTARTRSLKIDKAEAGAFGATQRGARLFSKEEDALLLRLVASERHSIGRNSGLIDWETVSNRLAVSFAPARSVRTYRSRYYKLISRKLGFHDFEQPR